MWELEKAGGKFDNFNSKQQKAIHELIDGLTEIPTKPNKDQYRVDNQSQYTKIVGRTYYNGEYALYAIQKGKTMYASIACPAIGPDISIDNIKEGFKLSLKDVFLRMDGKGISTACGAGAGKVNCQRSMAPTGAFKVQKQTDGTFTIESSKYPGVFLRMDGNGIHAFAGSGSGRVNCQFGASAWERFKLHEQSDGSYTIESAAFPNVFLRMDGNNPSRKEEDFGTVNCQYGAGAYEKFYLQNMPEIKNVKDMFNKITK